MYSEYALVVQVCASSSIVSHYCCHYHSDEVPTSKEGSVQEGNRSGEDGQSGGDANGGNGSGNNQRYDVKMTQKGRNDRSDGSNDDSKAAMATSSR